MSEFHQKALTESLQRVQKECSEKAKEPLECAPWCGTPGPKPLRMISYK